MRVGIGKRDQIVFRVVVVWFAARAYRSCGLLLSRYRPVESSDSLATRSLQPPFSGHFELPRKIASSDVS
jgi:hypothetical protein